MRGCSPLSFCIRDPQTARPASFAFIRELERVRAQNASAEEQAVLQHEAECERVQQESEKARQEMDDEFGRSYLAWESECASITRAWEETCLRLKEDWAEINAEFLVARAKQVWASIMMIFTAR